MKIHRTLNDYKQHKLTPRMVQAIRKLVELDYLQSEIAERFGITQQMVSYIVSGRKWASVPDDPDVDVSEFVDVSELLKAQVVPEGFRKRI
jgi:predicted transcriptional regulator